MINAIPAAIGLNYLYTRTAKDPVLNEAMQFTNPRKSLDYLSLEVSEVAEAYKRAGSGCKRRTIEELGDVIFTAMVAVRNLGGCGFKALLASVVKIRKRERIAKRLLVKKPWPDAWAQAKKEVG